jgi:DNA-directed RNA polymerase specialized sigma54-like protein
MKMSLSQAIVMPMRIGLPLGISDLELEKILEESLDDMKNFYELNPDHTPSGNYFSTNSFIDKSRRVKERIPSEAHIENPTFRVSVDNSVYNLEYNPSLDERIKSRLEQFKARDGMPNVNSFSKELLKAREWRKKRQSEIIKYLLEEQKSYLESGNAKEIKRIKQVNLAEKIGYTDSTVCRLMKNLTIQLPNGKVIYAQDLAPGNNLEFSKGYLALKELRNDTAYYEDGEWKVSYSKLKIALKNKFGIDIALRTVSKYTSRMAEQ